MLGHQGKIMVRRLGGKRAGTGNIEKNSTTDGTDKWTGAVAEQILSNDKIKDIIVKTLPVKSIKLSNNNPRKLSISRTQIEQLISVLPLKDKIQNEQDNEWVEKYIRLAIDTLSLEGKAIRDLTSLIEFASSLKSAKRLLHPIVVWKEDSLFNVVSGERRLLSHLLLNETNISAQILNVKPTQSDIDILQWEENAHREDMTLSECLDRLEKLINAIDSVSKTSVRKLAKLAGLSKTDAQRYLVILRYPNNILRNAINQGRITSLSKAATIAQLTPDELNQKLNNRKTESITQKPTIKLTKQTDLNGLRKIIELVSKEFHGQEKIENLDLTKMKDLEIAFNSLLNHIKAQG